MLGGGAPENWEWLPTKNLITNKTLNDGT